MGNIEKELTLHFGGTAQDTPVVKPPETHDNGEQHKEITGLRPIWQVSSRCKKYIAVVHSIAFSRPIGWGSSFSLKTALLVHDKNLNLDPSWAPKAVQYLSETPNPKARS